MTDVFEPSLMTTGIGSVPLADPDDGAAFVLDAGVSIPFWPYGPKIQPGCRSCFQKSLQDRSVMPHWLPPGDNCCCWGTQHRGPWILVADILLVS